MKTTHGPPLCEQAERLDHRLDQQTTLVEGRGMTALSGIE